MNKKWLIIGGLLIVVIGVIAFWKNDSTKAPATPEVLVNELPPLNVIKTDGNSISLKEVEDKSVLIFFNPDCDHCQREATQISKQKNAFRDYRVYFISIDSLSKIERFAKEYDLMENNFVFAQANGYEVYAAIGALQSVPAIFIYNKKKLVKRTEGEVKLEELIKYL